MALAGFTPDPYLTFSFVADTAITASAVVVGSTADRHITLPSGADVREGIVGVAPNAIASGLPGDVVTKGIVRCVANGTITRYDLVTVATSAGDVKSWNGNALSTGPGAQVVGMALESVTTGQTVSVLLLTERRIGTGIVTPYVAGVGGVTANAVVVVSTATDNLVVLPAGADPTSGVIGVALIAGSAAAVIPVCTHGPASVVSGSAGATRGDNLAVAAAAGTVKTAAPSAGTNTFCVGTALQTMTSAQVKLAHINPFMFQG